MSNSGVNAAFAKCFILFMSIVILLQGCVYLGLSILGITMEKCSNEVKDISEKPFEFILDLIYFANEDCGSPILTIPATTEAHEIDINWVKSFEITNRMNIFLITYAIISALWIITSLLVLTTICGVVTKIVSAVCYWPWFLVVMAGCILDAVATGYHVSDIYHTTSANDTLAYIGITINDENILNIFSNFDAYFITPAIIMTCVSSRVVLIWLLNIFGTIFCLSLANVLAKRTVADKRINDAPFVIAQTEITPHAVDANMQQEQLPPQQPQQQEVPYNNPAQYMERNPPQIKPKPLYIQTAAQVQRQNSYQQQQKQQQQPQQYQRGDSRTFEPLKSPPVTPIVIAAKNNENNDRNLGSPTRQISNTITEVPTYRNTDTHPDRLDYPVQPRPTSPELSSITPLNNRYSTPDGQQFSNSQQRVSDELRSHLPWSYTSMLSKPQPPRRVQSQVPAGAVSVYPEVPEPDYTLHPQRNDRVKSGESDINIQQPQSYSRW